jgi:hypothetical protein
MAVAALLPVMWSGAVGGLADQNRAEWFCWMVWDEMIAGHIRQQSYGSQLVFLELSSNLISRRSSRGGLILVGWFDAVDEIDALGDVGEVSEAA